MLRLRQECRLIWINAVPAIWPSVNCVILIHLGG